MNETRETAPQFIPSLPVKTDRNSPNVRIERKRSNLFFISIRFRMRRGYKYQARFHASTSFRLLQLLRSHQFHNSQWLEVQRKLVRERRVHRNEPVQRKEGREGRGRMLENDDERDEKPMVDTSIECSSKSTPMLEFQPKR